MKSPSKTNHHQERYELNVFSEMQPVGFTLHHSDEELNDGTIRCDPDQWSSQLGYACHIQKGYYIHITFKRFNPSKIEWDLTKGPLSKLLEHARAIRYSGLGVRNPWVLLEISWIQQMDGFSGVPEKHHSLRFK